jgi:nitrite reductase/ring-hydroxylating ferredoxin subunit
MRGKITIGIVLLSLTLVLAACAGTSTPVTSAAASSASNSAPVAQASQPPVTLTPVSQTTPVAATPSKPSGPVDATEIVPTVANNTVTIPVSAVQKDWNVHFMVNAPGGKQSFMAYNLDGQTYVRASICVPCRGKTFTLSNNTLVCDICGTTFSANTGVGISGACVNYPKASVPYQVSNGNIVMQVSDLATAYNNTLKPGLP